MLVILLLLTTQVRGVNSRAGRSLPLLAAGDSFTTPVVTPVTAVPVAYYLILFFYFFGCTWGFVSPAVTSLTGSAANGLLPFYFYCLIFTATAAVVAAVRASNPARILLVIALALSLVSCNQVWGLYLVIVALLVLSLRSLLGLAAW